MFRSAPVGVVVKEASLKHAVPILNNRQRRFALRLLTMPRNLATRKILPENLREGDDQTQPGEQEGLNWDSLYTSKVRNLSQRLANLLVQNIRICGNKVNYFI